MSRYSYHYYTSGQPSNNPNNIKKWQKKVTEEQRERIIKINNIPSHITEYKLLLQCKEYGTILNVHYDHNISNTNTNHCDYAYIEYKSIEEADAAITSLQGKLIRNTKQDVHKLSEIQDEVILQYDTSSGNLQDKNVEPIITSTDHDDETTVDIISSMQKNLVKYNTSTQSSSSLRHTTTNNRRKISSIDTTRISIKERISMLQAKFDAITRYKKKSSHQKDKYTIKTEEGSNQYYTDDTLQRLESMQNYQHDSDTDDDALFGFKPPVSLYDVIDGLEKQDDTVAELITE